MRVLLVDNHALFREGLLKLLSSQPDISVVGEASDSWEAVMESRKLNPDLIIFELGNHWGEHLEALRRIKEETPDVKAIVLTMADDEETLWQALKYGANGYLNMTTTPEQLFSSIRQVMKGETAISPSLSGKVLRELIFREREKGDTSVSVTPREREIIELLRRGLSDKEISDNLCVATSTVRHHIHNILRKLHLKNRVQVAMFSRNLELQYSVDQEGQK